jgi:tRNA (uracil-5-)-methyltransferase
MGADEVPEESPSLLPPIGPTAPSPLQYGYRTKITPHFDAPSKKWLKAPAKAPLAADGRPEFLKIGFNKVGTRNVMDIEVRPMCIHSCGCSLQSRSAQ